MVTSPPPEFGRGLLSSPHARTSRSAGRSGPSWAASGRRPGDHGRVRYGARRDVSRTTPLRAPVSGQRRPGTVRYSIEARFTPDSGVFHTLGSATGKRRPLVVVGTIRTKRPLFPACHGKSGRSTVSSRSWPV